MKLSAALAAAMAVVVNARASFTNSAFDVEAGKPFVLTWTGADGPVTITLKNGSPQNLQTVMVIDRKLLSSACFRKHVS